VRQKRRATGTVSKLYFCIAVANLTDKYVAILAFYIEKFKGGYLEISPHNLDFLNF